jgi:hypothetical protein
MHSGLKKKALRRILLKKIAASFVLLVWKSEYSENKNTIMVTYPQLYADRVHFRVYHQINTV